jgi:hypothetical protein
MRTTFSYRHLSQPYPLAFWFNGDVHTIAPGVDYHSSPASMRSFLYRFAYGGGMTLRTLIHHDGAITFQARSADGQVIPPMDEAGNPLPSYPLTP